MEILFLELSFILFLCATWTFCSMFIYMLVAFWEFSVLKSLVTSLSRIADHCWFDMLSLLNFAFWSNSTQHPAARQPPETWESRHTKLRLIRDLWCNRSNLWLPFPWKSWFPVMHPRIKRREGTAKRKHSPCPSECPPAYAVSSWKVPLLTFLVSMARKTFITSCQRTRNCKERIGELPSSLLEM